MAIASAMVRVCFENFRRYRVGRNPAQEETRPRHVTRMQSIPFYSLPPAHLPSPPPSFFPSRSSPPPIHPSITSSSLLSSPFTQTLSFFLHLLLLYLSIIIITITIITATLSVNPPPVCPCLFSSILLVCPNPAPLCNRKQQNLPPDFKEL